MKVFLMILCGNERKYLSHYHTRRISLSLRIESMSDLMALNEEGLELGFKLNDSVKLVVKEIQS